MDRSLSLKSLYVAIVIAIVTFVINIGSFSTESRNGVVISCTYTDYFALLAGIVLFLYGISRLFRSYGNSQIMLLALTVTVLGAVHVARGLGWVMGPCG